MFIKVNEEYAIESDSSSWAVCKWKHRSTGGNFEQITWHRTFLMQ